MIIDSILSFFSGLVHIVLGWLPSASAPNLYGDVASLSVFWSKFGWLNQYLPLSEFVGYGVIMLALFTGNYLFRAAVWTLTKAHILGGSSD